MLGDLWGSTIYVDARTKSKEDLEAGYVFIYTEQIVTIHQNYELKVGNFIYPIVYIETCPPVQSLLPIGSDFATPFGLGIRCAIFYTWYWDIASMIRNIGLLIFGIGILLLGFGICYLVLGSHLGWDPTFAVLGFGYPEHSGYGYGVLCSFEANALSI
ncbi:hypothetical protein U1Q18_021134 [Sarracenia purpurea var. burkii]